MTTDIKHLAAQVTNLDNWTQLSILGSWSFIANAAAINAAIRMVPDANRTDGVEGYTSYEAARRMAIQTADRSQLPALIALVRDMEGMILDADGDVRGIESTLQFLTQQAPVRDTFGFEYDNRVRLGMRPGITKRAFVDAEFQRAMDAYNTMVQKGDDACRLINTLTVHETRGYGDLPEWIAESFERKMIEKLHIRWEKLEMNRTNPRRTKQIRDAAAADQLLIEELLSTYGEKPGFSGVVDEAEQA